mgnify:FL=1
MPCLEHAFDKIVEDRGTTQASRAFKLVKKIMDQPNGVERIRAEAVIQYWNSCVDWEMPEGIDTSGFKAEIIECGETCGIKVGPEVEKILRRKKR